MIIDEYTLRVIAREALGLSFKNPSRDARELAVEAVRDEGVVEKNGLLYCGYCGKGPFTRIGLYLHIIRVHKKQLEDTIDRVYREIERASRMTGFLEADL